MSTALYRRYRPETFADVIGQEHVTEPLITALTNDRVNHAYLFSGPRGCGKTTSARILARCLNCAQGPTATPCGSCDSCRELSRDGGGSLDVIEMDAASHGGVDHARDLRERATFAPVRDRYKIFIIDEAHMVTREGFNALLKIVEEPPEHIKFIFATTEPNKVLGTIRSRTHHYPFRLVPPETLQNYLQQLCTEEGVQVADGVLPLVVRAGGGSVRDSLSILDQLMAGSDQQGITYDLAVALLGFTHGELLDDVVAAFASGDAAQVFASVDRVIQAGQDPRRFVEDLLERFRDLIVVRAVPEAASSILRGVSQDQLARLHQQAEAFGAAELSRAADATNNALNEMSGATSPQLHLELLCARILLPAADKSAGGMGARLERLERRVTHGEIAAPASPAPSSGRLQAPDQDASAQFNRSGQVPSPPAPEKPNDAPLANLRRPASEPAQTQTSEQSQGRTKAPGKANAQSTADQQENNTVLMVRNAWNEIIGRVQSPPARTWFADCQPSKFERGALYIRADIGTLRRVKDYIPQLKTALAEVLQLHIDVHAEVAKNQPPRGQQPQQVDQNPATPPLAQNQQQPPIAEGPRGGERAWQAHGQPRTHEAPQWSTEDWNNPVTDWAVASIPSETNGPEPAEPSPESGPQLRVIQGEAQSHRNSDSQARDNHPSSGRWRKPEISAAPEAENSKNPSATSQPSLHRGEKQDAAAPSPSETAKDDSQNPGFSQGSQENYDRSAVEPPADDEPSFNAKAASQSDQSRAVSSSVPATDENYWAARSDWSATGWREPSLTPEPAHRSPSENIEQKEPLNQGQAVPPLGTATASPTPQQANPSAYENQQSNPQAAYTKPGGFRERFASQLEAGHRASEAAQRTQAEASSQEPEEFTASDDDETLESTVLIGQKAVEKILGGVVIEEIPHGQ